jgi:predicted PhzF superfamily epimerase YddE/YHI9
MSLKFTVVDAFTNKPFGGNPAAVIVLPPDHHYPDSVLQGIALEFNLSETAFISHLEAASTTSNDNNSDHVSFGLRWFTPVTEVKLCGHATLASATVLFADQTLVPQGLDTIHFSTLSGILKARRVPNKSDGDNRPGADRFELEFPAGNITQANPQLTQKVSEAVRRATGKSDLGINFVGVDNVGAYKIKTLVDIDSTVDLQSLKVDAGLLVSINIADSILGSDSHYPNYLLPEFWYPRESRNRNHQSKTWRKWVQCTSLRCRLGYPRRPRDRLCEFVHIQVLGY